MILIWLFVVAHCYNFHFLSYFILLLFVFLFANKSLYAHAHIHTQCWLSRLSVCIPTIVWSIQYTNMNWTCFSIACALYECLIFAHWVLMFAFFLSSPARAHWNKNIISVSCLSFSTFSFDTNELRPSASPLTHISCYTLVVQVYYEYYSMDSNSTGVVTLTHKNEFKRCSII